MIVKGKGYEGVLGNVGGGSGVSGNQLGGNQLGGRAGKGGK